MQEACSDSYLQYWIDLFTDLMLKSYAVDYILFRLRIDGVYGLSEAS